VTCRSAARRSLHRKKAARPLLLAVLTAMPNGEPSFHCSCLVAPKPGKGRGGQLPLTAHSARRREGKSPTGARPSTGFGGGQPARKRRQARGRTGRGHLLVVEVVVLEAMQLRQLALTEDANDTNAVGLGAVEHDVAHIFEAEKPWADVIAGAANRVAIGDALAECLKLTEILVGLGLVPVGDRVVADVTDVRPRERR